MATTRTRVNRGRWNRTTKSGWRFWAFGAHYWVFRTVHSMRWAVERVGGWGLQYWWRAAPSRRGLQMRLLAVGFGLLAGALLVEIILRLPFVPLPPKLGNYLFSCYEPGNPAHYIYGDAPDLGLIHHVPDLETSCFFGGYRWHHHTDHFGGRNPETWHQAELAVLGDSMIYGHGVEETQTATHFLREALGVRVVNLGRTGASPVEFPAYYWSFALPLAPRATFIFIYANDLDDIRGTRQPDQIRQFVRTGNVPEARMLERDWILSQLHRKGTPASRFVNSLVTYRLGRFVTHQLDWAKAWSTLGHLSRAKAASPPRVSEAPRDFETNWHWELAYLHRAFATMAQQAAAADTELVVSYLPFQASSLADADRELPRILREMAAQLGVRFFDGSVALAGPDGEPISGMRLPGDGHLNESGHRRLASAMARYVREHQLLGSETAPPERSGGEP